jgi:nucleotide-binding universal stress UspA family protein
MEVSPILVPVDYSDCSGAALAFAAGLAATLGGSVDVIHVWDRPLYVSESVQIRHAGTSRLLSDMIRENAEEEMKTFLAKVSLPPGVQVSHRLLSGNPARTVLEELRRGRHRLLVVGTNGRTGLPHLLLGSVAETLVRHSPVPVATVPLAHARPTPDA